jgi:hypothetical protein
VSSPFVLPPIPTDVDVPNYPLHQFLNTWEGNPTHRVKFPEPKPWLEGPPGNRETQ